MTIDLLSARRRYEPLQTRYAFLIVHIDHQQKNRNDQALTDPLSKLYYGAVSQIGGVKYILHVDFALNQHLFRLSEQERHAFRFPLLSDHD